MQKSKKMMVSLCGLALSSLFVLNNKSVVHADTIDGSQNNAISWDSDQDDSQVAQSSQTKAEQVTTQEADDYQQNATQTVQNNAETSTVRSSSADRLSTNQSETNKSVASVRNSRANLISKVNDAQALTPVVINNPANDKVHVHYVDSNGNAVDNSGHDYDIDATKTGQGQYTVPTDSKGNKYQLNYPDGKYTVSGGAFNGTNMHASINFVAPTYEQHLSTGNAVDDKILQDHGALDLANKIEVDYMTETAGSYTDPMKIVVTQITGTDTAYYKPDNQYSWSTMSEPMHRSLGLTGGYENWSTDKVMSDSELDSMYSQGSDKVVQYMSVQTKPGYTNQTLPVAFVDANNNIVGMIQNYTGKVGTTQNVSLTVPTGYKLADGQTMPTSVTFAKSDAPLLIKVTSNGQTNSVQNPANNTISVNFVDQETHKSVGTAAIDLTKQQQGTNYYQTLNGWATDNNGCYDVGTPFSRGYLTITDDKGNNAQQLILNAKQAQDFFEAFRKGHDTDLSIQAHLPAIHPDEINLQDLAYNGVSTYDKENGDRSWENIVYNATKKVIQTETNRHMTDNYGQGVFDGYYGKITAKRYNAYTFTDNYHPYDASTNTVTVPVHKTNSFSFADNSGNVKSVNGNTVNVVLTKPQSVNPETDTRCQSQATRTIQINFPDGQIPEAYDGIVDKSGKLVQTVHFTRTATEDALTGNILQYGSWTSDNQDHNFIGFSERTLPKIPGYTLSIKPA